VLLALITGYALFFFISKRVHHVCPACAASHFDADATRHFSEIANALIIALAIHSTTDGLALGIQGEAPATSAAKWSLFSALCIHKVPEGLALGSLLIGSGLQRAAAIGWVAAVEATTLLGGVIGYFFLTNISIVWLGLIMAHVGGGIYLFGDTRSGRRNVEARKEACFGELCAGHSSDRRSQCWLRLLR
jgi:zinc transporter ZupT